MPKNFPHLLAYFVGVFHISNGYSASVQSKTTLTQYFLCEITFHLDTPNISVSDHFVHKLLSGHVHTHSKPFALPEPLKWSVINDERLRLWSHLVHKRVIVELWERPVVWRSGTTRAINACRWDFQRRSNTCCCCCCCCWRRIAHCIIVLVTRVQRSYRGLAWTANGGHDANALWLNSAAVKLNNNNNNNNNKAIGRIGGRHT